MSKAAKTADEMLIKVVVDHRERELIMVLKEIGVPAKVERLELGDISFIPTEGEEGKPLLVIERKTVRDLAASIKDGRAREQKARLVDLYVKQGIKVIYLIEGFYGAQLERCSMPFNTLLSSLVNTMIRDDITVYHVPNVQMSGKVIAKLMEKINEHYHHLFAKGYNPQYISQLKLKKKENKNSENSMLFMLCQVPHVSMTIAEVVRKKYPSILALSAAYEKLKSTTERELLLADIPLNEKRKIGPVISKNIYGYFS